MATSEEPAEEEVDAGKEAIDAGEEGMGAGSDALDATLTLSEGGKGRTSDISAPAPGP